jgi:hypothetical protein
MILPAVVFPSGRTELRLERQLPDPLPGGRENRVGQGRRGDRSTRLTQAARRLEVSHQVYLDRGRFVHPQDPVIVEVGLLDPAIFERDLAPQRGTDAEIDAAGRESLRSRGRTNGERTGSPLLCRACRQPCCCVYLGRTSRDLEREERDEHFGGSDPT